tara:strand:+ start:121 stop:909 length:789 start_codon:yes stop_codon:yes gene_type:complete
VTTATDSRIDFKGIKHHYERDGVAHIPAVFSKAEMDRLRALAFWGLGRTDRDEPYRSGRRIQMAPGDGVFPAIQFWPALDNWVLDEVRKDPRIQDVVRSVLGDDVRQLNNQLYYRMRGDGDAFGWHRDSVFRKGMSETFAPGTDYLQTVVAVDTVNSRNGGMYFDTAGDDSLLEMVDKENLRTEPDVDLRPRTVYEYAMASGDMLIWNARTPHASRCNRSDLGRMTYMNGFAKTSGCQSGAWPDYLVGGELAEVDPERIPYQ